MIHLSNQALLAYDKIDKNLKSYELAILSHYFVHSKVRNFSTNLLKWSSWIIIWYKNENWRFTIKNQTTVAILKQDLSSSSIKRKANVKEYFDVDLAT